LEYFEH